MKIDLQIGQIELESLPAGVDIEALRPAITAELERRIRRGVAPDSDGPHPGRSTDTLARTIADTIYRGVKI